MNGSHPIPCPGVFASFFASVIFIASPVQLAVAFQVAESNHRNGALKKHFESAVQAVGDVQAIADVRSIEAFAQCDGPTGAYTTELHSYFSNKTRFRQVFPNRTAEPWIFINQDSGWQSDGSGNAFSLIPPFQRTVPKADTNDRKIRQSEFAWLEVWQKNGGHWKLKSIASTDRPTQTSNQKDE